MTTNIKTLFDQQQCLKIEFTPEIKIKGYPNEPVWIDAMERVKDNYIVHISNRKDKARQNVNSLTSRELGLIEKRMREKGFICKKPIAK